MRSKTKRPARSALRVGSSGDKPAAMRSALTNSVHFAKAGRCSRAKVDLPAPLGPAIKWQTGIREAFFIVRMREISFHFYHAVKMKPERAREKALR